MFRCSGLPALATAIYIFRRKEPWMSTSRSNIQLQNLGLGRRLSSMENNAVTAANVPRKWEACTCRWTSISTTTHLTTSSSVSFAKESSRLKSKEMVTPVLVKTLNVNFARKISKPWGATWDTPTKNTFKRSRSYGTKNYKNFFTMTSWGHVQTCSVKRTRLSWFFNHMHDMYPVRNKILSTAF